VPNHAAYTAADVDDARRGHPEADLVAYAEARGLEAMPQALIGHFRGLNPTWQEYVFNPLRGELVPGRFGSIQHELDEVDLDGDGDPRQGGSYYGRRTVGRSGFRSLIGLERKPKNEPFAADAMWLPTTGFKLLVPELALLPAMMIRTRDHMAFSHGGFGASFRMADSRWISDELRGAVTAAISPTLETIATTYTRLEIANGAIGLRVDGFRSDPADLDRFVAALGTIAEQLTEVARPLWAPAPFEQPLAAPDSDTHPAGFFGFMSDGVAVMERDAAAFNLVHEDPADLHRRFPRLPLPGTSLGVLAGTLPGSDQFGRLTWQTFPHAPTGHMRRAALVAVAAGAPTLPPGGVLVESTDMYVAAADGVAGCWTRTISYGKVETADLAERALASFRESAQI